MNAKATLNQPQPLAHTDNTKAHVSLQRLRVETGPFILYGGTNPLCACGQGNMGQTRTAVFGDVVQTFLDDSK